MVLATYMLDDGKRQRTDDEPPPFSLRRVQADSPSTT
jgi:hypothetical protein